LYVLGIKWFFPEIGKVADLTVDDVSFITSDALSLLHSVPRVERPNVEGVNYCRPNRCLSKVSWFYGTGGIRRCDWPKPRILHPKIYDL